MLQKTFFRVDVLNPNKITNVLLDHKFVTSSSKAYSFIVPEGYNNVVIEYAGGSGGSGIFEAPGGGGSIKKLSVNIQQGEKLTINGVIGAHGLAQDSKTFQTSSPGGEGYVDGEDGISGDGKDPNYGDYISGGGGGGATAITIKGITYIACGGGGSGAPTVNTGYGGKGGGEFGGQRRYSKITSNYSQVKGNDATDPEQIGLNKGAFEAGGYIKVFGNYDPNL